MGPHGDNDPVGGVRDSLCALSGSAPALLTLVVGPPDRHDVAVHDVAGDDRAPPPDVAIEMVWGDITQVEADFVAVGHYKGMTPTGSELALDHAISGNDRPLVLTEHTRRGLLSGDLGDIKLFPWHLGNSATRVAAVAGLGYPATFGENELRALASDLAWVAAGLPEVSSMATVLIGSGSDNMRPSDAVDALVHGLADTCRDGRVGSHLLSTVRVVEWQFDRAIDALDALRVACEDPVEGIMFRVGADLLHSGSGGTSDEFSLALALASIAQATPRAEAQPAIQALLAGVPAEDGLRAAAYDALQRFGARAQEGTDAEPVALARSLVIDLASRSTRHSATSSTRMSFIAQDGKVTVSAITDTATVPERLIGVDLALVREAASANGQAAY